MLYTNQTEIDTIQFITGQEGSYLRPADVIKIQDKLKSAKRYGGRIKDIDYAAKTITLDKGIEQNVDGQKITCVVPRANTTVRALNKAAEDKVVNNRLLVGSSSTEVGREGMTTAEVNKRRQTQIREFTIASLSEDRVVTISETEDQSFNLIKKGSIWSVQNTSASYEIEEIEYRVLSVLENSSNEYQVSGMMYNRTKFGAVDQSKSIQNTQQSKTQMIEVGGLPTALSDSDPSGITQNFVVIEEGTVLPVFNARFPLSTITANSKNEYIKVEFASLIGVNSITAQNTGGYIINLFRGTGNKVTFALDGYDNTTFYVLLGSGIDRSHVCFQIYRYDTSFKLESTGL
jgi:predicted phage tail protein